MKKNMVKKNTPKKLNKKNMMKKTAKNAEVTPVAKNRGRPRKNPDEVKALEKTKTMKRVRKQTAKKMIKKPLKNLKKSIVKKQVPAKNDNKNLMKQAKKLFGEARKNVSALKKTTKMYGKLLTDIMKSGDEKMVSRVNKLFGYVGYALAADNASVNNTITTKVKVPKVKTPKTTIATNTSTPEMKSKRKYVRKNNAQVINEAIDDAAQEVAEKTKTPIAVTEVIAEPAVEGQPQVSEEPSDEELANIEKELSEESDDDSDIDEEKNEDDLFETSDMRDRAESDSEVYDAMRENGDID